MLEQLLAKFHVRSGALLVGAFFAAVGMLMVFQGIHDEGFIDLKSAVVSGRIKSGLVGATFAFLGAVIVVACVLSKPTIQRLKVKKGTASIEWEGVVNSARAMLAQMESMAGVIGQDHSRTANNTMQATRETRAPDGER